MNIDHATRQRQFETKYYGQLIGAKIVAVTFDEDEFNPGGDRWVTLHAHHPKLGGLTLTISQDEEGNGPGFIFGLPFGGLDQP